ncbi:MAG TPA: YCF48-related protein, partial [Ignavibacteria bacterium]
MKKIFTVFAILLFTSAATTIADPQYYNYNNGTSYNSFPFNQAAGKMIQGLIAAGEFNQPGGAPSGNITSFSVRISNGYPLGPVTYTQFRILFLDTNLTALPSGSLVSGNWDTVYYRATTATINAPANTWLDFPLDHPHAYNNTRTLVFQIEQCAASGTFTGFSLQHTTTGTFRRTFSIGGCPFSYGGTSLYVPNCGVNISINCGYTWASQVSGVTNLLQAVWTVNNNVVWAAGAAATVRKTTDGGTTWTNANPNPGVITGDIYNIWALDVNTALCTTSPNATFIYRTTNGGTNWTQVFTQTGGFIDAIILRDANTGFAYGDPVATRWSLWKTTNGGANWDSTGLYLPQAGSEAGWNNAMSIVGNDIWFGTNNTRVYHSTNFGATGSWSFGASTGSVSTYGVWFTNATTGICVGTVA